MTIEQAVKHLENAITAGVLVNDESDAIETIIDRLSSSIEFKEFEKGDMKCKYCEESAFTTIIENSVTEYGYNIWGNIGLYDEPLETDTSVVFEMRCGSGYIRLGDRCDMECIDHCNKIQVNYCPMCGKKLAE